MWILRPCNYREFCNTADEHHAICLGLLTPFFMWSFVLRNAPEAKRLFDIEVWYVAFGMSLRVGALILIGRLLL
jgi:hypothetical protein